MFVFLQIKIVVSKLFLDIGLKKIGITIPTLLTYINA